MKVEGLIWLEEIEEKLWRKHRVETDEVWEIFEGKPRFWFVEMGNRPGEDVYLGLGRTAAGRYLSVFFIYKEDRQALIVSARDMAPAERKRYERK